MPADTTTTFILPEPRWRRILRWPFKAAEREPVVLAFGIALTVNCCLYRAWLAWKIYSGHAQGFSLQPEHVPVWGYTKSFASDALMVLALTLLGLGINSWLRRRLPRLMAAPEIEFLEEVLAGVGVALFALALRTHHQLLLQMETGLTWSVLQASRELIGTQDFLRMFQERDTFFIIAPVAVFMAALRRAVRLQRIFRPLTLLFTAAALLLQLVPTKEQIAPELRENPVAYLLDEVVKKTIAYGWQSANGYDNSKILPGAAQLHSIQLMDEAFVAGTPPEALPEHRALTAAGKPWNVLLFVMESTGTDYIFEQPPGQQMPMPFLQRLAAEGIHCTNHYANCNSSPDAAFSILSGLYAPPEHVPFSLRKDTALPLWNTYLGNLYASFLIHPSHSTYSFPVAMLQNGGITDLYFQEQLPLGPLPDHIPLSRNEINTIQFLEHRLDTAREPFFGVYWSFVPHHPYSDYGAEYRIRPDVTRHRDRYINNLRLLDTQLEHLFQHLAKTGLADHTVVVLVGDHGEAFGQRPGYWSHGFGSYGETYRAPLIFWQPKLFGPRVVDKLTTHADILPTLLDLLGAAWNPARLQGESLQRPSTRKYIFAKDMQAEYLTSISTNGEKVSICLPDDEAYAYNLTKDPGERLRLSQEHFAEQINDLLKFSHYQKQMIEAYNTATKAGQPYPPPAP